MMPLFHATVGSLLAAALLVGCASSQSPVPGAPAAHARSSSAVESVLYSFRGGYDGWDPTAGLVTDSTGALYGTTVIGGMHGSNCGSGGCGTVYKLTPAGSGYTERVIHHFSGPKRPTDGVSPSGGLVITANGTLYGTTYAGGRGIGDGTIFRLTPVRSHYEEKVLYRFSGSDGATPYAGLTAGSGGALYGTTFYGGSNDHGTVFEFVPATGKLTTLHAFGAPHRDGALPMGPVALDASGNIYGTTEYGGHYCGTSSACGTVFKLTRSHSGYRARTLYEFRGRKDGEFPTGSLVIGGDGAVYGTTQAGGKYPGCGTIFALTPHGATYAFSVIYSFTCGGADGAFPAAGLVAGANGTLYGTAEGGGNSGCNEGGCGTVYALTQTSSGHTLNALWSFQSSGDGNGPDSTLLVDASGTLYGTTTSGGVPSGSHDGTVFKVTP
jgi:uncharacterized repeat protein (TIGR03803 family)